MGTLKSLEDLKRVKEQAMARRKEEESAGRAQVAIGMGTCGIAAGARDTMKAVLDVIEKEQIDGVAVIQIGCRGLCESEPIVEVTLAGGDMVRYGKVDPKRAEEIVRRHIMGGEVISEWVVSG